MKKLFFVLNPYAGTRKANKLLTDILSIFCAADFEVTVHITQKQDDARQMVCQRAKDVDLIVCCGGDGTFNETVAGVLESGAQVPIGYIPAGSTNDFANSLGLASDPLKAATRIAQGEAECFDVGCFNGRYFTYVASFGIFTKASYGTPQNAKNTLGHLAYLLNGLQEFSQLHNSLHVNLEIDGEVIEDDFIFGAVCNSTSMGGVLKLDPKRVDMSDGLFEVMLIRAPKDLTELAECIQALQKQTYDCTMLTFRTASKIRLTSEKTIPWSLDGEMEPGAPTVEINNLHRAFRLVR